MAEFKVTVEWQRTTADFAIKNYNRSHHWSFEGGSKVEASAPPVYLGEASKVNPEQAFTAAMSSCHMLTFLAIASQKGLTVDHYEDHAVGVLGKNVAGKLAITQIILQPKVKFSGDKQPTVEELHALHHQAHEGCFIANSVLTEVKIS